jgi:hypothetical protein
VQDHANELRHAGPLFGFGSKLASTGRGEGVILRAAVVLALAPFAEKCAVMFEAVERRIKRTLLDRGLTPFCNCSDASSRLRRAQLLERLVRSRLEHSLTAQSLDRMTRMECRSQADQSLIIQAIIVHSTQVDLVDCCADSSAQARSCILVGSKMYPAVNASVGDVFGNLPE